MGRTTSWYRASTLLSFSSTSRTRRSFFIPTPGMARSFSTLSYLFPMCVSFLKNRPPEKPRAPTHRLSRTRPDHRRSLAWHIMHRRVFAAWLATTQRKIYHEKSVLDHSHHSCHVERSGCGGRGASNL